MRKILILVAVLVCSISVIAQTNKTKSLTNNAQVLPIHRVILYSNGVSYIERRGMISGDTEVNLSFKQSQVDDVLKSMIVLDLGEGKIGAVSYNSSQPVSARTSEIPFSVDSRSDGGIYDILSQLQGAKVAVSSSKGISNGSILTVEKRTIPSEKDREANVKQFLVIASDSGEISSFDLSEVRSVKLLDDETKQDVKEFANATASARRRDAKTITVTSEGIGQREMIVSYTIAAPIWKTTYRVVLDKQGKPFFQGWAIVDNVSEEDWQNVQLSLVSGSPVSFIQNLQKPLYRYRPIVPIPDDLELEPQIYDPSIGYGEGSGKESGSGGGSGSGVGSGVGYGNAPPPPMAVTTSMSEALMNETSGVQTAAIGSQFGDLFEYRIEQPVTVPRNRSALIPIIQTKMDGERVSIFRPTEDNEYEDEDTQPRPMSGMLLTNTTPLTFEGGSLTVIDGNAYAGEALMERLKPEENRLISFALDLGTLINIKQEEDRQPAKLIKAAEGAFEVHYFKTDKKVYQLQNQTDSLKYVYIEHPIRKDWKLAESTLKPDEITNNFYRFRVELPAFARKDLVVTEIQGLKDSYRLGSLTFQNLELFVKQRYVDENTKAKLFLLIDLRSQIAKTEKELQSLDIEINEISNDQNRLRENIKILTNTSEAKKLIERYVQKADEQESRIEQINKERRDLQERKETLERELANQIKNFEIIGK